MNYQFARVSRVAAGHRPLRVFWPGSPASEACAAGAHSGLIDQDKLALSRGLVFLYFGIWDMLASIRGLVGVLRWRFRQSFYQWAAQKYELGS